MSVDLRHQVAMARRIEGAIPANQRADLAVIIRTLEFFARHEAVFRQLATEVLIIRQIPEVATVMAAFPGAEIAAVRATLAEGAHL
ncbi:MAG: hypothetical protein F9K29_07890 [Hyphomicrobiaceae bacterium]|nr:MAG: hypothetical protein F9K29_07890 [Hyphomicrobiaceae bacterium]